MHQDVAEGFIPPFSLPHAFADPRYSGVLMGTPISTESVRDGSPANGLGPQDALLFLLASDDCGGNLLVRSQKST